MIINEIRIIKDFIENLQQLAKQKLKEKKTEV